MSKKVNIAIDAMGGENSPKKIIEGIKISLETNKNKTITLLTKPLTRMIKRLKN